MSSSSEHLLPRWKLARVFCGLALGLATDLYAAPIYVYREGNATRFSNKPPPPGVKAEVFTAKGKNGFSYYSVGRRRSNKLYSAEYDSYIHLAAKLNEIDPSLIRAVIHAESGFDPRAVSPKGALGLMQLMPDMARSLGVKHPFDPGSNIQGGAQHLAFLLRKYDGNLKFTLAAYNAGAGAVEKYDGVPPYPETVEYVRRVLELRERYKRVLKAGK